MVANPRRLNTKELNRVSQALTDEVETLDAKVAEHLKKMRHY